MRFCDMHCDTMTELYSHACDIADAPLHISLEGARGITPYIQLSAVWTESTLTDGEGYERFFDVVRHFRGSPSVTAGNVKTVSRKDELASATAAGIPAFILGVEGGRILEDDISRLDALEREGVRLMTLQWSGADCIGGAYDTDLPLTDFGRAVVRELALRGMATDISHACDRTAEEALDIAIGLGGAVCASHSNARAVTPHPRNLPDSLFLRIRDSGGVVGISLCPEHLREGGGAGISDILRHISHYLDMGGEDTVCLGCDFDGISSTPEGIGGIGDIRLIRDALLREGIPETVAEKIFFKNAERFLSDILKK